MVLSIVSILLIIVVLMLLWILLGSFTLTIDTQSHDYSVRAFGVLKGCVLMRDGHLFIEIEVPFYQKSIDVEAAFLKSAAQTKRIQEPKAKKKTKSSSAFFKRKIQKNGLRVLRSFKIKKCYANIDTNDCSLNGRLYPLTS
ncbi:MAG: hypothetical protein OEQ53_21280, partial [Saprospiraceae bacterium]|nr:hypothetical protein [Saprospiraceae bacterium]